MDPRGFLISLVFLALLTSVEAVQCGLSNSMKIDCWRRYRSTNEIFSYFSSFNGILSQGYADCFNPACCWESSDCVGVPQCFWGTTLVDKCTSLSDSAKRDCGYPNITASE